MTTHKSEDYKVSAVNYYLTEDTTQEEVCKIFKCTPRSLMRRVERYKILIFITENQLHIKSKKNMLNY